MWRRLPAFFKNLNMEYNQYLGFFILALLVTVVVLFVINEYEDWRS